MQFQVNVDIFVSRRICCTDWINLTCRTDGQTAALVLLSPLVTPAAATFVLLYYGTTHEKENKWKKKRFELTHMSCSFTKENRPLLASLVQGCARAPTRDASSPASDTKQGEGGCLWRHSGLSTYLILWRMRLNWRALPSPASQNKNQPKEDNS